jgi:signal peptidase I
MKIRKIVFEIIETIVVSAVVVLFIYYFIASVEVVWGPSMEPNFYSGERILVDRSAKREASFKRGDVIVFYPPNDDSKHYIKRIVGIPGDVFKIIDCKIVISRDGEHYILYENYLPPQTCTKAGSQIREGRSIKIPEGQYVLLGDNRDNSLDSRNIGLIDESKFVGRVVFRLWPLSRIGFIN